MADKKNIIKDIFGLPDKKKNDDKNKEMFNLNSDMFGFDKLKEVIGVEPKEETDVEEDEEKS